MAYATNTSVSVSKTKGEIEHLLHRYGADGFGYTTNHTHATIGFQMPDPVSGAQRVAVKMTLTLPDPNDPDICRTPTGKERKRDAALAAWEQACRSRWRALLLVIKAKLEAIEIGITTLEREFLADVLLPTGETVHESYDDQRAHLGSGARLLLGTGADE